MKAMLFTATARPEESRSFYSQLPGCNFVTDSPHALVFEIEGTELRIQKVDAVAPAPYTTLGFQVDDIDKQIALLTKLGIEFARFDFLEQDQSGIWRSPDGARVAWFKDPDGNTLSLTQSP
jgi:catechol 2,3-dioxygenase-like lactoylglutathione lyase family enzyme